MSHVPCPRIRCESHHIHPAHTGIGGPGRRVVPCSETVGVSNSNSSQARTWRPYVRQIDEEGAIQHALQL